MRASKLVTAILVSPIFLIASPANGGLVWTCEITGELRSDPVLTGQYYVARFFGQTVSPNYDDFCADRLHQSTEIKLSPELYEILGEPKAGETITLLEFKEENDYGSGLKVWRYFDFGFDGRNI